LAILGSALLAGVQNHRVTAERYQWLLCLFGLPILLHTHMLLCWVLHQTIGLFRSPMGQDIRGIEARLQAIKFPAHTAPVGSRFADLSE
jgi:hypothetical protein